MIVLVAAGILRAIGLLFITMEMVVAEKPVLAAMSLMVTICAPIVPSTWTSIRHGVVADCQPQWAGLDSRRQSKHFQSNLGFAMVSVDNGSGGVEVPGSNVSVRILSDQHGSNSVAGEQCAGQLLAHHRDRGVDDRGPSIRVVLGSDLVDFPMAACSELG